MQTTINQTTDLQTLAMINHRAQTLFTEAGYKMKAFETSDTLFFVLSPDTTKPAYIVDTAAQTCSCPSFEHRGICKHKLAVEAVLEENRRCDEWEAEWKERQEAIGYLPAPVY